MNLFLWASFDFRRNSKFLSVQRLSISCWNYTAFMSGKNWHQNWPKYVAWGKAITYHYQLYSQTKRCKKEKKRKILILEKNVDKNREEETFLTKKKIIYYLFLKKTFQSGRQTIISKEFDLLVIFRLPYKWDEFSVKLYLNFDF